MVDLKVFRRVCFEAAGRTRGTVTEFRMSEGQTPNFHQGIVAFRDRSAVAVVLARDTAILAIAVPRIIDFTDAPVRSDPLTFVDFPGLTAALIDTQTFEVLEAGALKGPFDATQWPHISSKDVHYWKPASLGEALFNYWD